MRRLALLVLGLVSLPAMALTNIELYRTEVLLDSSAENADAQARIEGMKEVIVRASGDTSAASNQVVTKALKQNSQYLTQISYGQIDGEQTIKMAFSEPHIRSLLSQAQLPVWPSDRANVLVWLVEEQAERNIIWEHSDSELLATMKSEAEKRGLPITVPVGDFDDVTGVNVSDLWGGFVRPVGQASQRYPVDAVLVVKAQGNTLRWTLYDQKPSSIGVTRQAPVSGTNTGGDAASKLINQISDYYAKHNAVVASSESSEAVKVRFTELTDAVGFFKLENNLKKLSSVASIDIVKIQSNEVTFNVHLLSSQAEFEQEVQRKNPVTQMASIVEQPEVVELAPIVTPQGEGSVQDPATTPAVEETPAEVAPTLPAIKPEPAETILVFKWQGKPYVAPMVEEQPSSEDEVSAVEDTAESETSAAAS